MTPRIAGVVLAGGLGSRMGGPKHAIVLRDGRTMLECVLAAFRPLGLPVLLSVPFGAGAAFAGTGLPAVEDATRGRGPLEGLASTIAAAGADFVLAACCDQPLLDAETLARLLPADGDPRPAFFCDAAGQSLAPFPGLFPASGLESMRVALAAGDGSPRRWALGRACRLVPIADPRPIASFNTRDALREAGLIVQ